MDAAGTKKLPALTCGQFLVTFLWKSGLTTMKAHSGGTDVRFR